MNRRGFMKAILAAGVAPYVVTSAGVLMPVRKIKTMEEIFLELSLANASIMELIKRDIARAIGDRFDDSFMDELAFGVNRIKALRAETHVTIQTRLLRSTRA